MASKKSENVWEGFELVSEVATKIAGAGKVDPTELRRNRFLDGLNIQRKLWNDPNFMVEKTVYEESEGEGRRVGRQIQKQPRKWWSKMGNIYYISPRYGARPVELQPGLSTARIESEQVPAFFNKLEELVNAGYFDEQFTQLASRNRKP